MKKIISGILVITALICVITLTHVMETEEADDLLSEYNIVFYEAGKSIEDDGSTPNIVVLTEEQLL